MTRPSLEIPASGSDGWNLERLLQEYGRLTDQHFLIRGDSGLLMRRTRVSATEPRSVPPRDVHRVVEALLVEAGFVLSIRRESAPRLVAVAGVHEAVRDGTRMPARYVPAAELEAWTSHPAHRVRTVVHLPDSDTIGLANAWLATRGDLHAASATPAGRNHSMIVRGLAPQVAECVDRLREFDARARESRDSEPQEPVAPAPEGEDR